eukprot:TRINITY_DN1718_c0_g1_i2.p1 TRINITY_DN1718_c0_g1~~TRINITY_DN1718_c0_g1_i2.p1  ORF type:complete len:361 (+),score=91.16 TRINITY_DN1718_c0_g1_i2:97-1179(+)
MSAEGEESKELLSVSFNQDKECFAVGTTTGFQIYNCKPFGITFSRDLGDGIGQVQMLYRCNLLALVGGGTSPYAHPNKVMIWDDHQNRCIGELSFRTEVKAVRLRRDRIAVALTNKVYVYNFSDLKVKDHFETGKNPLGLLAFSPTLTSCPVLACPGINKGHVFIKNFELDGRNHIIHAHESELACLELSMEGKRLATASMKGTLIRIFDTSTAQLLKELRRGSDRAFIHSLAFSANNEYFACTSDKRTVHVWKLSKSATESPEEEEDNSKSSLSFMKGILPKYFSSVWSHSQFKVKSDKAICGFTSKHEKNSLVVVTSDGVFIEADPTVKRECTIINQSNFWKASVTSDETEETEEKHH